MTENVPDQPTVQHAPTVQAANIAAPEEVVVYVAVGLIEHLFITLPTIGKKAGFLKSPVKQTSEIIQTLCLRPHSIIHLQL